MGYLQDGSKRGKLPLPTSVSVSPKSPATTFYSLKMSPGVATEEKAVEAETNLQMSNTWTPHFY